LRHRVGEHAAVQGALALASTDFWGYAYRFAKRLRIGKIPTLDMGIWTGNYGSWPELWQHPLLDDGPSLVVALAVPVYRDYDEIGMASPKGCPDDGSLIGVEFIECAWMASPRRDDADLDRPVFSRGESMEERGEEVLMRAVLGEEINDKGATHRAFREA
jgi:hypothetical protein